MALGRMGHGQTIAHHAASVNAAIAAIAAINVEATRAVKDRDVDRRPEVNQRTTPQDHHRAGPAAPEGPVALVDLADAIESPASQAHASRQTK